MSMATATTDRLRQPGLGIRVCICCDEAMFDQVVPRRNYHRHPEMGHDGRQGDNASQSTEHWTGGRETE